MGLQRVPFQVLLLSFIVLRPRLLHDRPGPRLRTLTFKVGQSAPANAKANVIGHNYILFRSRSCSENLAITRLNLLIHHYSPSDVASGLWFTSSMVLSHRKYTCRIIDPILATLGAGELFTSWKW
jgi:hypothetical protein